MGTRVDVCKLLLDGNRGASFRGAGIGGVDCYFLFDCVTSCESFIHL